MINPVPMELSFNWCSHNCYYCFANLNKPDRWADIKSTMRLLSNFQERKSLEAQYLRWGLPTIISNRVDPFAVTNEQHVFPVLEMMTELGLPIAFQTKGGRKVYEALEFLEPAAWYISIAFNDSALAKKIEPGAPSIEERIELICALREKGHAVNVGINPCTREWLPNPEKLLQQIKEAGAHGVWVELLHFSRDRDNRLSDKGRKALTPELVARAKSRKHEVRQPDRDYCDHVSRLARDIGLHPFTMGQHEPSQYFSEYEELYPVTFPTLQDFINDCHAQLEDGELITLDDFLDYFLPLLPEGRHSIGRYIAMSRSAMKQIGKASFTNNLTFEELLTYSWQYPKIKFSPFNNFAFAYAAEDNGPIFDEYGNAVMMFCKNGTNEYLREVA